MRYRIGEVADFFGLTKEGVRYYERKGVLHPTRDEKTGYRYYERDQIARLKRIRFYESVGFSLQESRNLVMENEFDGMEKRIGEKLDEVCRKERELASARRELEHLQEALHRMEKNEIRVLKMPAAWFLQRVPDEASARNEAERIDIIEARNDEKRWTLSIPDMSLCRRCCDRQGRTVCDVFGAFMTDSAVREHQLPVGRAVCLPEHLCINTVMKARMGETLPVQHLFEYANTHGYRVCDDGYAIACLAYNDPQGIRWGVHEVRIPVTQD